MYIQTHVYKDTCTSHNAHVLGTCEHGHTYTPGKSATPVCTHMHLLTSDTCVHTHEHQEHASTHKHTLDTSIHTYTYDRLHVRAHSDLSQDINVNLNLDLITDCES